MPYDVLLIQDNTEYSDAADAALSRWSDPVFHLDRVRSLALGVSRLTRRANSGESGQGDISAILLDLELPDLTGIDVFDRLFAVAPLIPILIVASGHHEEAAQIAVRRGAWDYFLTSHLDGYFFPKAVASMIAHATVSNRLLTETTRARIMLDSIGDSIISTNLAGDVTYLNKVAEQLTGWSRADAVSRPIGEVFKIVDADSRRPLPDPMTRAAQDDRLVALPPSCILIGRHGAETAIEDSCAPMHDQSDRVIGAIMVFHDVTTARAVTLNLAYLARHDSLTDLPNRVFLNDRLTHAMSVVDQHQTALALLYLDLDSFKHINDSLGHLVGDRLLKSVAARLRQCVRASDTVSRQGGDEFVILLPEIANAADAVVCAEKIIQAVKMPYRIDENEIYVTTSVGIVIYPRDGVDVDTLLQNADYAMYEAKAGGRDNYRVYRPDVNSKAVERQVMETGLRQALQRQEFVLHYQPMVDLATSKISGVEALIRWQHPSLGFLLPAHFMSIAEASGLIVPIGRWVLCEGCRQVKAWQRTIAPGLRLAVNISAVELGSKEFLDGVRIILQETGFDPGSLDLELTETFLMQDADSTAMVLRGLKDLGVHLALDDFGTGYSSLSYMRRFPIDVLKIDRSFVSNIAANSDDAGIASAIINMGKSLHMRVVAEGVESEQQLLFLEEHDCTEAQGFYFSRPLAANHFEEFIDAAALLADRRTPFRILDTSPARVDSAAAPQPLSALLDTGRHNVNPHPVPGNEHERLAELYRYKILDTPPEEAFDRLTRLAADACDVPIALISFVDRDRQWFKSHHGLAATETSREHAFCAHTILGNQPFVVENAGIDPRFADNALVRNEPGIRFYAAVPLVTSRGFALGSLCIIDRQPRRLSKHKLKTLQLLAAQVVQQIELREVAEMLRSSSLLLDKVQRTARIGGWEMDLRTNSLTWTHETYRIHGMTPGQYRPTVESALNFYTPDAIPVIRQALRAAIVEGVQFDLELRIRGHDGSIKWVRTIGTCEEEAGEPRRVVGVFQDIDEVRQLEKEIVHIAQREQTRIGLDLHDGLGQELTGIAFMMSGLLAAIPGAAADELRPRVTELEGLFRSAIGTCAALARGLSPTGRDRRGLIGALRKLAAGIEKLHPVKITVNAQGRARELDSIVADHLYRIVQESISNAIKHGPALNIEVFVEWSADRTLVAITNDGHGSGPLARDDGMGLEIMRYRARLIGATMVMSRTSEGGVRVRCHLPRLGPDLINSGKDENGLDSSPPE